MGAARSMMLGEPRGVGGVAGRGGEAVCAFAVLGIVRHSFLSQSKPPVGAHHRLTECFHFGSLNLPKAWLQLDNQHGCPVGL